MTDSPYSLVEDDENVNEIVYFTVTNVEHSVPSRLGEASSLDMYVGATVGELGCWIDTSVTRMVQTGIEHSRVPDMGKYLGGGTSNRFHITLVAHRHYQRKKSHRLSSSFLIKKHLTGSFWPLHRQL